MKKLLFILLLFVVGFGGKGQNLVPNPSFEVYDTCPNSTDQISRAVGWSSYGNSSDYYNACASPLVVGVPQNGVGYQYAADGNAYAGLITFFNQIVDYREFIGCQLSSPLTIGQKYFISFEASLSNRFNNCIPSDKLGVRFSNTTYSNGSPAPIDNFAHVYTDTLLTDTSQWMFFSSSFVTDSAYSYLIMGNFFDDLMTDTFPCDSVWSNKSYYFIDNVCVSTDSLTCAEDVGVTEYKNSNSIKVFPNPTTGMFTVQGASGEIQVYDLFGRLVLRTNKPQIDMSSYPAGLYIWRIGTARGKVVVE